MNQNKKSLPENKDTVIIHYGCSSFDKKKHQIYWIGAIYYLNNEKTYFFEDGKEKDIIELFKIFFDVHQDKTFIHWSMNSPSFGFSPIKDRYQEITGNEIALSPKFKLDLSEYLKGKYGVEYVSRQGGRLNNLAKLNGFSGHMITDVVKTKHEGSQRLELIFSIYQAEKYGKLKVSDSSNLDNPYPLLFINADIYLKFIEYISKHIQDFYSDYSYLKKRLEFERLIHNQTDTEFMRILHEELKLITEEEFEEYFEKGKLSSLEKSKAKERISNFNKIFINI
mgnify:FL=1